MKVSSLHVNPAPKPHGTEWAERLIPGAESACWSMKKPPRSVGATFLACNSDTAFPLAGRRGPAPTLPQATQNNKAASWLKSRLPNYVWVMLDWILVSQVYLRLQIAFPSVPSFPGLLRTSLMSPALIGISFLHGVLINLLNYRDRVHVADTDQGSEMRALGKAVLCGTLLLSAALRLQGFPMLAVAAVWAAGVLHFGTIWEWHTATQKGGRHSLYVTRGARNVLIVGAGSLGRRIANYLGEHPEKGRSVCGFLDDGKPLGNGVLGRTDNLVELARAAFVDEVILAPPYDQDVALRVVQTARQLRLDLKVAPQLFGCEPVGEPERIGSIPLISLHEEKLPVGGLLLKRALDIAGASAALILLGPALMLIGILIKLDSPGPVLYKALRAGRKGRPFHCYKFRTMVRNADDLKEALRKHNQRSGPFFKIANDPRVTSLGRLLRRYSLDELPQLWNVLKGEMSMVGPRPHPLDDVCTYAKEHLRRLDVVPGMTGLWQVTARKNPSFQTGVSLDVEYIRRWSVRMDLLILLRTAGAVLRGSGE